MDRNSIIAFLGKDWEAMQMLIFKALGSDVPMLDEINRRLLDNAGKMLRPRLTMLFARICFFFLFRHEVDSRFVHPHPYRPF